MPTIKFVATKMSDAKVSHISLVERGANRIPFRVVKEEKGMSKAFSSIDLGGLFSRRKAEVVEPQIIAVATMNGDSLGAVKASLEKSGFSVEKMEELEDGSVIFKQGDCTQEEIEAGVVVRLSESVALVTKGFSPYNMDMTADGVTFADQCAASGFYPAMNNIMTTLGDAVRSVVYASKTPADAKAGVDKLFSEAAAYVGSFVAGLPVKAFKLEEEAVHITLADKSALAAVDEAASAGAAETGVEGAGAEDATKKGEAAADEGEQVEKGAKPKEKDPAGAAAGGATGEEANEDPMKGAAAKAKAGCKKAEDELKDGVVADMIASKVSEANAELVAKFDKLFDLVGTVTKAMTEVKGSVDTLQGRVEKAEQQAAESVKAIKGVVVPGSEGGDTEGARSTAKSEESVAFGDIDTAFMPRRPFPSR